MMSTSLQPDREGSPFLVPCIIADDQTMSRGEVWQAARALARDIGLEVPTDRRTGLVDTRDAASLVGIE
jgi:hypothetical protein